MLDVLVIEDNEEIGTLLCDFLRSEGYTVYLALTGEEGMQIFRKEGTRLVVLDIMLPGIDGFSVCREIRSVSNVPVIIVSAKTDKEDKLNGLLLGADDYMEKPYDIDILTAKIQGIFKRRYENSVLTFGELCLDKDRRSVTRNGQEVSMAAREFDLLLFLAENSGKAITKEKLFYKVWGFDSFSEPQTLTVHIKRLREKIEEDPKKPKYIQTVWGVGYRFEEQA